jgi:Uma2 family endonuclease
MIDTPAAPIRTRPKAEYPPLEAGDRMTATEFERRYAAMPGLKKAELLRGVVYMPSPVRLDQHGEPHADMIGWLGFYKAFTRGVRGGDNSTVRLDDLNEPQPDILLLIPASAGGQSTVSVDGYVTGAPELVCEVASSSRSYDLGVKLDVYREFGVREYVVWRVGDDAIDWFALRGGRYEPLPPGPDGILRSEVFPGLWLDPAALIAGDMGRVLAVVQQGAAAPEHQAFVQRLARTP